MNLRFNKIYHTSNGGNSWFVQSELTTDSGLLSIFFTAPDSGWVGGYIGLWRTIDGGTCWEPIPLGKVGVDDMYFINSQEGWAVGLAGNNSAIFKTVDGGLTWKNQAHSAANYARPRSVYFTDRNHGWIVGTSFNGQILYTSNSGEFWEPLDLPSYDFLYRVKFPNPYHGWILGRTGIILHTASDDPVSVDKPDVSLIPNRFALHQNYPNPFNPMTTIRYTLPERGSVQLLIYDELGRLVRKLVDEAQTVGEYAVVWDGKNSRGQRVASGTYFYTLKVGNNTLISKRMLMIK